MRVVLTFLLVLGLVALVGLGQRAPLYRWSGAVDEDWDDPLNWSGPAGFPDGPNDTAEIPAGGAPWEINQMEYTIGQMTILDDVDFEGTVTLTTGALIIDARGGEEIPDPVVVEIVTEGGKIIANP